MVPCFSSDVSEKWLSFRMVQLRVLAILDSLTATAYLFLEGQITEPKHRPEIPTSNTGEKVSCLLLLARALIAHKSLLPPFAIGAITIAVFQSFRQ